MTAAVNSKPYSTPSTGAGPCAFVDGECTTHAWGRPAVCDVKQARHDVPFDRHRIDARIHELIDDEFARAYDKHNALTARSWTVGDDKSLAILVEEVGEIARALCDEDTDNLVAELVQVATVAAAWAERIELRGDA